MKVLITGGCGFIGLRLTRALLKKGSLIAPGGRETGVREIVVCDVSAPPAPLPEDTQLRMVRTDVTDARAVRSLVTEDTTIVFHLAAAVSAEAEADFDLGMHINLHGTLNVLDACRRLATTPRMVFASSVAVYGGAMPEIIEDSTALTPQSSYGAEKALAELLINDYSRKKFIDGRAVRLPTVVVRPGKPNRAASSFASSIIREPLQGEEAECPVPPETGMWILSPRRAVESLIRAAELPADLWGSNRAVALPGLSLSVAEMVEGLRRVAGKRVAERVRWRRDARIEQIVCSWPARFAPRRAEALGFKADRSMDEIIQAFIDDELDGRYVP
ncbi:MAG: D-erythronate dehydrogenase [Acidiferrobacterales bacterium]